MGLPTTANYVVVSTLMAPVLVSIAGDSGLALPLIPQCTCLSSISAFSPMTPRRWVWPRMRGRNLRGRSASAPVSRVSPMTSARAVCFLHVHLQYPAADDGIALVELRFTVVSAVVAILLFAAGRRKAILVRSRIWGDAALLLISFSLFRPGFWMDQLYLSSRNWRKRRNDGDRRGMPEGGHPPADDERPWKDPYLDDR